MRLLSVSRKYAGTIEVYDDAVGDAPEIVRYLEWRHEWHTARVGVDGGEVDSATRNNAVTFINPFTFDCPDVLRSFAKTVWAYLDDYANRYDCPFAGLENVNVNRYYPGEYYRPHADDGPGHNRVISALVYLNNVEQGGGTEFIHHDVTVHPKAGRLVIFPSNYAYAHAAHPPVSGVKYSAAFWTLRP